MFSETRTASIIIPTFNGADRIGNCLGALLKEKAHNDVEIIVVSDGSTDNTADVVRRYPTVRLVSQTHAGPAAARNRGALEACGEIILFTDDDCVPAPNWLNAMRASFRDLAVVGAKGVYRTSQKCPIARFVQAEYEDRYRLMTALEHIDFVDTYSAAFRRASFLAIGGYDTSFPVACAEDVDLSYRMSAEGWIMKFVPSAVVYHTHPGTLRGYLSKKYKFAFWRVFALRKNPEKVVKDSHTPQLMKLQLLFPPAMLTAFILDLWLGQPFPASGLVLAIFLASTLPFAGRAFRKDPLVGLLSPFLLAARACAQLAGVIGGTIHALRRPVRVPTRSHA